MTNRPEPDTLDLVALARQAALDEGFELTLSPEAERQRLSLPTEPQDGLARTDLRALLWSSVDNVDSQDLDQIEVAEALPDGAIRLRIGLADVDAFVPKDSPLDQHAGTNTTSIYTGVALLPMLPDALSTDRSSLAEGVDRAAVVVSFTVLPDGTVTSRDGDGIALALVRNRAKLAYETVGPWLAGEAPIPETVGRVEGLEAQLRLQREAADRLRDLRMRHGALNFETIEAQPVVRDGVVTDLRVVQDNPARDLIENLMVTTNSLMAEALDRAGVASLRRVVQTPKRWDRLVELAATFGETLPDEADGLALAGFLARRKAADPGHFADLSLAAVKLLGAGAYTVARPGELHEGHFALAVQDYTHSTAPNRRYVDLITQRLIKAVLAGDPPPYSADELDTWAKRCTTREGAANKVERFMRKAIAASWMHERIGEPFRAMVTGVKATGTFVRLIEPPVEGRIVRGESGLDVGDTVAVTLVATDPARGFIDFERADVSFPLPNPSSRP